MNHRRIQRLLVGRRPRHRRVARTRAPTPVPPRPDQRWSIDFVRHAISEGRPFPVGTLAYDATR